MEHPVQDSSLVRFAAGTASRDEARTITRHLLRGCQLCAERLREIIRPPVEEAAYSPALDAFARICLGRRPRLQVGSRGEGLAPRGSLSLRKPKQGAVRKQRETDRRPS
jgi:hypothetical protein